MILTIFVVIAVAFIVSDFTIWGGGHGGGSGPGDVRHEYEDTEDRDTQK